MKNFYYLILIIIHFAFPFKCFGLEQLNDMQLASISGQSGVTIGIDDIKLYYNLEYLIYEDSDGRDFSSFNQMAGNAYGAHLNLLNITLDSVDINFITPGSIIGRDTHFHITESKYLDQFLSSGLTIDVTEELPKLNWYSDKKFSGILAGLPTVDIYISKFKIDDITMEAILRTAWNNNYSFGSVELNNIDIAIVGGRIAFFPFSGKSIGISVDDVNIFAKIDEMRYTDLDGLYNPINDEYDNFYLELPDNEDGPHPASLVITDLKVDLLRINSLVLKDLGNDTTPPSYQSPGTYDVHTELNFMKNLKISHLPPSIVNLGGQPLVIDVTSKLPNTTKIYNAAGLNGNIAGIRILIPTVEIYADEMSFSGIQFDDPMYPENFSNMPIINDETKTFGLKMEGALTAVLSGTLEVAPR